MGKYKQEDDKQKEKIEARNALENYAYSLRNSLGEEKIKEKIPEEDRTSLNAKIDEAIKWLDEITDAEKEQYEERQKELEGFANPIMMKAYGGGAGGMPGAEGMPGAPPA